MKQIIFTFLILIVSNFGHAQESKKENSLTVKQVPTFKGCKGNNEKLKRCFNKKFQRHFVKNFKSSLPNNLGLKTGRARINLSFRINKKGIIDSIKVDAPHPKLIKECLRVIKKLPKMIPGKQKGKDVSVKYSIPFSFTVE